LWFNERLNLRVGRYPALPVTEYTFRAPSSH
jgi:hypothetical protein